MPFNRSKHLDTINYSLNELAKAWKFYTAENSHSIGLYANIIFYSAFALIKITHMQIPNSGIEKGISCLHSE